MRRRIGILLAVLTAILCLIAGIATAEEGVFVLPSGMKTIKAEAFYGADWLTEVKLPSGVQTIGSKAFAYSGLKYIHLPASLTSIADDVFTGCSGIRVTAAAGSYAYDWAVRNGYIIEVEPLSISATADTKTIITGETRPSGTFTITGGVAPYSVTYGWYADGYEYPQQVNYADLATAASADWEFEPCSNTEGAFRVEFTCVDSEDNKATYTLSGFQMQEPEPDDSISVSSSSTSSPYTVTVVSSGSWKATSNASWLTLSKTSGSAGTSTVKVTAAANTTGYDRTGKVTFTCGSATDTFTVTQEGVLATPTNFRATLVESGLVRLSWNAVTGAEEYKVYYGYSADDLSSYEYVTGTTVDIAVLTIASKAYFQVRAVNSDDVSDKTEILEVVLEEEEEPYVIVTLSSSSVTLTQSATYTLTCDVQSNTTTHSPVWTSSNTSVATVSSSGVVKAVGEGTAVITCSVTGDGVTGKATCTVKVNGWVMPPTPTPTVSPTSTPVPTVQPYLDVTLSDTKITLDVGDTYTLACSVNTNVTAHSPVWTSSNTSVATVSSSGKVTAVGAGTATITCSVSGNGVSDSATCKVTVTEPFVPEYINVTLNKTTLTLEVGDYDYLSETVDTNLSDYSTAWKSSNTSVAKVSTSGKVTAVSKGTATITCTVSGNGESDSATCKVTVVDSGCTFDVSTNSWSPSYSTATTTIDLTLHSGHSYTVDVAQYNSEGKLCDDSKTTSSDNKLAEWLTVTENSTSVKLAAEAHYAVNSRKATVTVSCDCGEAEYDITVKQSGGAPKPASVSLTMAGGGGFTETSTTIDTTIHDHTNYKLLPGDTFGATVSTGSYARRVTIRIKPLSNSYNVWESYTTTTGSSGISKTFSCTLPDDLEPGVYKVDVYAANSTVAGSDSQYIQVSAKFTVVGDTPDASYRQVVVDYAEMIQEYKWTLSSGYILLYYNAYKPSYSNGVFSMEGTPYIARGTIRGIPYTLSSNNTGGGAEKSYTNYKNLSTADKTALSEIYTYDSGNRISMKYGMSCATFVSDCLRQGFPNKSLSTYAVTNIHEASTWKNLITKGSANSTAYASLQPGDYLFKGSHVMLVIENTGSKIVVIEQTPPDSARTGCTKRTTESITITYKGVNYTKTAYRLCMECDSCKQHTVGTARNTYSYSTLSSKGYYAMYVDYTKQ